MRTANKLLVLFLVLALTGCGGFWLGYQMPKQDVDPQDYIESVFTPYQDGLEAYLEFLDRARTSVEIACYSFTEPAITDKLLQLARRGVTVRILTDRSQSAGKYQAEQIRRLKAAGIEVVIGTSEVSGQIMHHKFTVVDGLWVADGSFNYTRSANRQANVLNFVRSRKRAREFQNIWDRMHAFMSQQKQPQSK